MTRPLHHVACGEVVYEDALAWQRRLWLERVEDRIGDVLVTLTHDPVYTAGRHADLDRNLVRRDTGVRVVEVERGGDLTYHGPGQLVAYPVLKLPSSKAVRGFVEALLEACRACAAAYGLDAVVDPDRPGVWVGGDKIAAVGVRVDRHVTFHGLAFNVDCDLAQFTAGIVPCGIQGAGVASLASLGVETTVDDVRHRLVSELSASLRRPIAPADAADDALGPPHPARRGSGSVS